MLIVEAKSVDGFIFNEVEKVEAENHLELDDSNEMSAYLNDPKTLNFLKIPFQNAMKKSSNMGICGLSNLGNTCFMNSALQCLSNTTELSKYFIFGLCKDEINYKNNLGTQGRLVAAYTKLMKEMWVDSDPRTAPWDVKKSIG